MNPKQTPLRKTEIADRRQQVAEMYLRGEYQSEIAAKLNVDQATVSRDLTELRKEWLDRSINHIDQKKAIELAKLDKLEVTYWEAWERSLKDAETTIERDTPKGTFEEHKTEGRDGNPAFLEGVLKCITKRCEIIGINAPLKIAPTDPTGQKSYDEIGFNRALSTLVEVIGKTISGTNAEQASSVASPESTPVAGSSESGG